MRRPADLDLVHDSRTPGVYDSHDSRTPGVYDTSLVYARYNGTDEGVLMLGAMA